MIFKLSVMFLLLLCTARVRSMDLICESRQNLVCRSGVSHPDSQIYGLQQNYSSYSYYGHSKFSDCSFPFKCFNNNSMLLSIVFAYQLLQWFLLYLESSVQTLTL